MDMELNTGMTNPSQKPVVPIWDMMPDTGIMRMKGQNNKEIIINNN